MSKTRTILISAVAISLLAGSAVGVAAQETEAAAPAEFSATWDFNFGPGAAPGPQVGHRPRSRQPRLRQPPAHHRVLPVIPASRAR